MSILQDIEAILADTPNRQYEELQWYWDQWREVTGKVYREEFLQYVDLQNQAAQANSKFQYRLIKIIFSYEYYWQILRT